jgi:penicillin-binding protein 1B
MYLLGFALQDVVHDGTAQSLKNWLPVETGVAGKTGTTDEQRDAWFAGFTGDKLGIVWVGYDDNRAARLSGASAALPVWGEMMAALTPEPLVLAPPEGIEMVSIDPQTGLRGGVSCPGSVELPFVKGSSPEGRAPCSGAGDAVVEAVGEAVKPVKSWLERLFGK